MDLKIYPWHHLIGDALLVPKKILSDTKVDSNVL